VFKDYLAFESKNGGYFTYAEIIGHKTAVAKKAKRENLRANLPFCNMLSVKTKLQLRLQQQLARKEQQELLLLSLQQE
jgi:hypothetical protein